MKIKKEFIFLFVAIAALSVYLIQRETDRSHYQLPQFTGMAVSDITRIEITKSDLSIVLEKTDDTWRISPQGYPADKPKVESMLKNVQDLTLTAMVSESKNYIRYGLIDEEKINIKIFKGDALIMEFEVGKQAGTSRHTFIRPAGDHRVYHARGNLKSIYDHTTESLRDRSVLAFDKNEISKIEIAEGNKKISLTLKKEIDAENQSPEITKKVWVSGSGKKPDEKQISILLGALSKLRCVKFINDRKKKDFVNNPIYEIRLTGNEEYVLSIFTKTGEETGVYPAVSSGSDYPFELSEGQTNNIIVKPEQIFRELSTSK
ncbi:MAG: hypothetical protein IEMM0002_0183 [bacterium]|nr:MAG: hypothetical protein IEMM0002_0183 [bacterium]